MRHPTDGTLRRLLDEPAGVADADREHVAGCPVCLSGLAAAREDAAAAGAALDVELAVGRGRGLAAAVAARSPPTDAAARRRRLAPAAAGAPALRSPRVAALAVVAAAGRGRRRGRRGLAADLPRPSGSHPSRSPRPTSSSCPTSPPTATLEVTEEADVREVADAAAAEEATGLSVPRVGELPRGVTGEPDAPGRRPGERRCSRSRPSRPRGSPRDSGEALPPPPAGPRRQPVPAGRRPGARRGLVGGAAACRPWSWPARSRPPRTPRASRSRRPATTCCPCRGSPTTSPSQLRGFSGDGTTLPLPVPDRARSRASAADVGGAPATVLTVAGRHAWRAWSGWSDGVVTAVAGSLSDDEVLSVARGLRWDP